MSELVEGLSNLGNPAYWAAFSVAVVMAVLVGLIPGVSATLVMALSISFVVLNISDPLIGIVMLATLTGVDNTLDSIPAVLLGQPGGATQVTFLEGNQLARRGLAAYTLGAVYAVSAIGGVIGALALLVVIPVIKPFILSFGFSEIASFALFGVAMVAALSAGAMIKGIAAAAFGLLLGTIGIDPISSASRYTFGTLHLWSGLPLIATTIGLFALPEMIDLTMTRQPVAAKGATVSTREVFRGVRYGLSRWPMAIRHSLFGVFLGAVPGIGGAVVDWLSYAFGIFWSKDKSEFGKGSLDGVLFAESAQNSKEGGQAIPTLAFGVPGGRAWAFVIVAMLAYGITPGPPMLGRYADITIMMVVSLALGNLAVTVIGMFLTGQLAKLTLIPYPLIGAIIIPISFLSAFLNATDIIAIYIVVAAAGLGLLMKQFKWPRPPLLLGFILGPIIEFNFQSAISVQGAVGMLTRPLTIILILLAVGTAVFFSRMGKIGAPSPGGEHEMTPLAEDFNTGIPRFSLARLRRARVPMNASTLFTVGIIAACTWALVTAFDYPTRGRVFPVSLSSAVIVLALVQLGLDALQVKSGDIMDIGMRSAGMAGIRTTAYLVFGLVGAFILLIFLIGLKYATPLFAAAVPLTLLEGRARWYGAIAGVGFVTLFNLVLMDRIMAVIWYEPLIPLFRFGQ
jgi:TctA family transporter